ncbi:hypothetical protein COT62_03700 [Candidatus Roizmanbacteria bacterium CG09_land_8_20_14_0_10_41_9]|uniref:Uncharacterized protein n=1 Tax=Candidatus Roizmanbacteria bacterium CG09_land_8_20_14_0_10_41_9 TaxID=1974850 RepID=A0A2H0WU29_9BACT|nr:MAG: hypothetical protein COT62_03700 [Candidatus Roizmanbacteria bacterium CG09_land_8_20_14_0_10_41_9]
MDKPIKIGPKFWGDGLWFNVGIILIFQVGILLFFFSLSRDLIVSISLMLIMTVIVQPIFFLLLLDQALSCVVFNDHEVIFQGFLYKTRIAYREIINVLSNENSWPVIVYQKEGKKVIQTRQIFFWAESSKKVIDELEKRTGLTIMYPEKIAKRNAHGRIWFAGGIFLSFAFIMGVFLSSPPPSLRLAKLYCQTRYNVSLTDKNTLSFSSSIFHVLKDLSHDFSFSSGSPIYLFINTTTDEPRCTGKIYTRIFSSDGKEMASNERHLVPKRNQYVITENLNNDNLLIPGRYKVTVYYESEKIKEMNVEIK